jgi:NAD(P)-dependent dehydrogenase (short-subunit alcohol dehydrogenase family)
MTDRILEGKTVLMTGAGRGMERSMSVALAAAGAKVAMIDIDEYVLVESAKEAEDAGGQGSTKAFVCDVTDATRAKATAEEVISTFGSIDVLVNDAVVGPERIRNFFVEPAKFWELDDDLWNAMLQVNIFGPQLMAKTCAPYMIECGWGRIVNVTTSLDRSRRLWPDQGGAGGPYGDYSQRPRRHRRDGQRADPRRAGKHPHDTQRIRDTARKADIARRHAGPDNLACLRRFRRYQQHAFYRGILE